MTEPERNVKNLTRTAMILIVAIVVLGVSYLTYIIACAIG